MISSNKKKMQTFGLAADGKPANVPNGHKHTEIDTGKVYRYSEGDNTWYEQPSSGGGGGGGGNVLVVETTNSSGTYSDATATSTEIFAAADAGALPVLLIHNYYTTDTMPLYYAGVSGSDALFTTIFPGSTFAIDSSGHVTMQ